MSSWYFLTIIFLTIIGLVIILIIRLRSKIDWAKLKRFCSQYAIWFLINFGFGLLPIAIILFHSHWKPNDDAINGLMTYSFTLLVSSIYVFTVFKKNLDTDNVIIIINWCYALKN